MSHAPDGDRWGAATPACPRCPHGILDATAVGGRWECPGCGGRWTAPEVFADAR